jgi:hypothetical protein
MKKAIVILKDETICNVEYGCAITDILFELNECHFVSFNKAAYACDTIAMIEWID